MVLPNKPLYTKGIRNGSNRKAYIQGTPKSTIMSSETIDRVYRALKNTEPQTPNEIAKALRLNQKTVQSILLELANIKSDVKWKKIGRYRLFWKEEGEE